MNTDTVGTNKTLTTADFGASGNRPAERAARATREAADADGDGRVERHGGASTENMRVALRRYRSFYQRLLSL